MFQVVVRDAEGRLPARVSPVDLRAEAGGERGQHRPPPVHLQGRQAGPHSHLDKVNNRLETCSSMMARPLHSIIRLHSSAL